ncbi:MAG: Asp-tRNA(Asn)/Glu-tRNA(Gln) amidotransferase subunit GatA [Anaerolineae bacterium]|nr:Asp-tRNA(Asn)/Glu-tRNA(Gln) amidotransferase subunit GatA [Anaerolineae bacterium]
MELHALTIHAARAALQSGDLTSVTLTESLLNRIYAVDNQIRAYLSVTPEVALEQAEEADRRRAAGDTSPLLGIPFALKDVICTEGLTTTCGSRILHNYIPPYDATAYRRLREAGAILLGKTNMDEFAMGSSTENSAFFTTRNPWDLERVPGGSSGGSAAAVAADEAIFGIGTDTGGSIRQPAALVGIVGLRPTYGRVSRFGLVAYGSSLDQIGPLTKDVTDAALVLGALAGHDPLDSTSLPTPVPNYETALRSDIRGLRVAVPKEYFVEGMEPGVERAVRDAIQVLAGLGAEVGEVSLPHTEYALPTYYIIAPAEASANLARYDGVRYGHSAANPSDIWDLFRTTRDEGFGAEVKRRIMLGTYALSAGYYDAYYRKAQQTRTLIKRDFDQVFTHYDVVVCPTSPSVAFPIGARVDNPLQMYLADIFTLSLNLAGLCGMSIPCGFSEGLPVGLQFMGPPLGEPALLRAAYAYEQATPWHTMKASLPLDVTSSELNETDEAEIG